MIAWLFWVRNVKLGIVSFLKRIIWLFGLVEGGERYVNGGYLMEEMFRGEFGVAWVFRNGSLIGGVVVGNGWRWKVRGGWLEKNFEELIFYFGG